MADMGKQTAAAAGPASRLAALDGLRGIAAGVVAFVWLRDWGWTFVDLFFLISGYIFAHVYLGSERLDPARIGDFAVARIARLYPLHLLTLLVSAAMFSGLAENTVPAFLAHLVMMQAFVGSVTHTYNGPSWSITVEVVCYAVFVLGAVRGDRTLRWVTAAAIGVALLHFAVQGRPGGPWVGDSVPRGLLGFFLGQVLWRHRAFLGRVPAVLLVAILTVGLGIRPGGVGPLLAICLLAWPAALLLALRIPAMGRGVLAWLGDRSYAVYLIHYPILTVFISRLEAQGSGWQASAITLAYSAVVLVLSDLAYRRFEVPARRAIRAGWERRSRADPEPGTSPA
ncbi:acyltransferase family protein [Novosphingobium sp. BL-52-GroH]|uniref:acyltransferase family protein n=1 Tax=Novosphingobium sp. BL-52-GroH TaxID=3349877 RepID=UPI00384BB1A0